MIIGNMGYGPVCTVHQKEWLLAYKTCSKLNTDVQHPTTLLEWFYHGLAVEVCGTNGKASRTTDQLVRSDQTGRLIYFLDVSLRNAKV